MNPEEVGRSGREHANPIMTSPLAWWYNQGTAARSFASLNIFLEKTSEEPGFF